MKELNEEYYKLMADKKKLSSKYYEARATMQEILKAQKNVEMFLDWTPTSIFALQRRESESGKKSELVQVYTACQFVIAIISTYKKLWR